MSKLFNLTDFRPFSHAYVETGSCEGESIKRALQAGFTTIKSIEVHEPFYKHCQNRFKRYQQVQLFLGTSQHWLHKCLTEPSVVFLDANPAGPGTGGHDDLMEKGEKSEFQQNTILKRELSTIVFNSLDHLVIVDDQNGIDDSNRFIISLLSSRNPNYSYTLYDQKLEDGILHKDKILVCDPQSRST